MEDFKLLYDRHHAQVRSTMYRLTPFREGSELDDAVQEVFIRLWKGMPSFEGRSNVKTWIYRITVNTAWDLMRKRKWTQFFPFVEELLIGENHEGSSEQIQEKDMIRKALQTLSLDHRVVFVLHVMEGHEQNEVAQMLEVPVGTVKSRLHHARLELQNFL